MPAPAPGSVVDERPAPAPGRATHAVHLDQANQALAAAPAQDIIRWAYDTFGSGLILTSSFGVQAAVMLHLATQVVPDIPVVFIDTGYLHKETYLFADELARRLKLNLQVYQSHFSPARMEALHGRLWEVETKESLDTYDRLRKVEPMQRALRDLSAKAWLAGLRKGQTEHRNSLRVVERQGELFKVHPILNWTGKQVHEYLKQHDLPYHPLRDQGYASIGDWHSTRPIAPGEDERAGRFKGLKQECGLHLPTPGAENASLGSSDL